MRVHGDVIVFLLLVTCCYPSEQISKFFHSVVIVFRVISVNSDPIFGFFDAELDAGSYHDIILSGNMSILELPKAYTSAFQIATTDEAWILRNLSNLASTISKSGGTSVLTYFFPTTKEILYSMIKHISAFETNLDRDDEDVTANRRAFFVKWPSDALVAEIKAELDGMNDSLRASVKLIHLNDEIYIVPWNSVDPRGSLEPAAEIIEMYGIRNVIPVIQTVPIRCEGQIDTESLLPIATRRRNLHGATMKAVGQQDSTYEPELKIRGDNLTGEIRFVDGSALKFLRDFSLNLNFTYEAVNGTGWIDHGGALGLTGMGEQLLKKQVDFIISTSSMELYRAEHIRFLQPVNSEEALVFFRQPSLASARSIFLMPFSLRVWLHIVGVWTGVILVAIIISCPVISSSSSSSSSFRHIGTGRMYRKYMRTYCDEMMAHSDIYLWTIGVFCQQGWAKRLPRTPIRLAFLTALITSLLLYAFYTGAFVATISQPSPPVRQFGDLFTLQFDIIANPSEPAYVTSFARSEDEVNTIEQSSAELYRGDEDAVKMVMDKGKSVAVIVVIDSFYAIGKELSFTEKELCEIEKLAGNRGSRMKDAMIVRKQSKFKELLGHQTVLSLERGLARRYWLAYAKEMRLECLQSIPEDITLGLHECYPAFVILSLGYALALLLTLWEKQGWPVRLLERLRSSSN